MNKNKNTHHIMSGGLMSLIAYGQPLPSPHYTVFNGYFDELNEQYDFIAHQLENKKLSEYDKSHLKHLLKYGYLPNRLCRYCHYDGYKTRNLSNYASYQNFLAYKMKPMPMVNYTKLTYDSDKYNICNASRVKNHFDTFLTDENMFIFIMFILQRVWISQCYDYMTLLDSFSDKLFLKGNSVYKNLRICLQTQTMFSGYRMHEIFMRFPPYCYHCCHEDENDRKNAQRLVKIHDGLNMNWNGNERVIEKVFVDDYLMKQIVKYFL